MIKPPDLSLGDLHCLTCVQGLRFAATFSGDSRGSLLVHVWEFVEDATGTVAPQAMTQQATRHARRVYVGGLPPGANEQVCIEVRYKNLPLCLSCTPLAK